MTVEHRIAYEDEAWPEGAANPLDTEEELEELPQFDDEPCIHGDE
jgi:hypothetical protein